MKINGMGEDSYYEPHHKLDFNLDLLLSNNYICHFLVMEASLMKRLLPAPPALTGHRTTI